MVPSESVAGLFDVVADDDFRQAVGYGLLQGITAIQKEQTYTGEIASYQRTADSGLEYRQTPFVSTFVYDALGIFDPHSPWVRVQALQLVPVRHRSWFVHTVTKIRKRIRAFCAWQEEANGMWRSFGRGSGIDPDADTTACAAMVLLDRPLVVSEAQWMRHVRALHQFRTEEGRYFSYVNRYRQGYSWMGQRGEPKIGFDRVVNANVLRYLAYVGEEVDALVAYMLDEATGADFEQGSPDYPNPLCFFYMVARAWRQATLPGSADLARALGPVILHFQTDTGEFGGPLSTAMALSALLDLDWSGDAIQRGMVQLLARAHPERGWEYEAFFVNGFGSAAWSTALAMAVLARYCTQEQEHELWTRQD